MMNWHNDNDHDDDDDNVENEDGDGDVNGDGYKNVDDLFHIPGSKLKLLCPLGLPHTPVCKL